MLAQNAEQVLDLTASVAASATRLVGGLVRLVYALVWLVVAVEVVIHLL